MHVAFDLDNTLDTFAPQMQSLMMALRTSGHVVSVMTGASEQEPTPAVIREKIEYLSSLGLGDCWDWLIVIGDPPHERKAELCRNGYQGKEPGPGPVDILVDNSLHNARLAAPACLVLVPWNTVQD